MNHHLKILPCYYEAVLDGRKTFEIRNNADRGFQAGDTITLKEFLPDASGATCGTYTTRELSATITYVTNYEQREGFVVFAFKVQP